MYHKYFWKQKLVAWAIEVNWIFWIFPIIIIFKYNQFYYFFSDVIPNMSFAIWQKFKVFCSSLRVAILNLAIIWLIISFQSHVHKVDKAIGYYKGNFHNNFVLNAFVIHKDSKLFYNLIVSSWRMSIFE